jgi:hypothetical protein
MKKRINSSSNQDSLAVDAIHVEPDVWPGHGIHTTNEIFGWVVQASMSCLGILL